MYRPIQTPSGAILQSGVPKARRRERGGKARGLLLRGVVVVTYVVDDPAHPDADVDNKAAVYCDCVIITNIPGSRWLTLPKVLVSQDRGGIHEGRVWKPKAATLDITKNAVDANKGTNPANLDGDHVLIGFLNDNLNEPVILKGLPHPVADVGQEDEEAGHRLRLKVADGNPDYWKHRGAFYGVSKDGDFIVDLTQAYATELGEDGKQPTPPGDGSTGNYTVKLPSTSKLTIEIDGGDNLELDLKSTDAKLTLGNGAVSVAIGNTLQTFYGTSIKGKFDPHIHPTGTGPSGATATPLDAYDTAINSTRMTIPDNP